MYWPSSALLLRLNVRQSPRWFPKLAGCGQIARHCDSAIFETAVLVRLIPSCKSALTGSVALGEQKSDWYHGWTNFDIVLRSRLQILDYLPVPWTPCMAGHPLDPLARVFHSVDRACLHSVGMGLLGRTTFWSPKSQCIYGPKMRLLQWPFSEKWRSFPKKQYFCKCNGMAGFRGTRLLIESL